MLNRYIPTFALLLALAGCAGNPISALPPDATPEQIVKAVGQFTVGDLAAADAIAVADGDEIAHACYPALQRFVKSLQPLLNETHTVKGAFSAYQRVRSARRRLGEGIPVYLRLGCAALFSDSRAAILKAIANPAGLVPAP